MSNARLFILAHQDARKRALQYIAEAPEGYTVTVAPPKRTGDQNARLHAVLTDISRSLEWAGQKLDVDTWKRLLTAAWMRARGEGVQFLPALDGQGVDIVFRHTSSLSRAECAELMEFVDAWSAQQGLYAEVAT